MLPFDFLSPFIELIAAVLGFVYVYLIATEKASGWIFGIFSAFFYAIFFQRSETWGLFSQQIAYIILGIYGLFTWADKKDQLPIRSVGKTIWIWVICGICAGLIFFYVTGYSATEQTGIKLTHTITKVLENWHVWIVVNSVGIIWFITEHWWSTAVLYLAYLILAINGLRKWKSALYA